MPLPSVSAKTVYAVHPAFDGACVLNFTQYGIGDRTIASVDAIDCEPAGPVFQGLQFNAAPTKGERQQVVAAGKAALFNVSGCVAGQDYDCACHVTYSDGSVDAGAFVIQCRER